MDLYKVLQPELNRRAIASKCDNPTIKPYMTERDIINYVSQETDLKVTIGNVAIQFTIRFFFYRINWTSRSTSPISKC